ncbi:MAG: phosphate ABC transporter substrate-binding/OmpA family protein [Rhodobacteraceae bacterium]|nr:phosphate ABC transporter substrate-binding/OmpA family protein [Paracoccaceae bacterium]
MMGVRAAIYAALFYLVSATQGLTQDVTLKSRDSSIVISGTLLGFDGEFYRVETVYGELTVDGSGVLCEGPGCPSLTDFVADLEVSGSATIGEVLMPALIEGFALRHGYVSTRVAKSPTEFAYELRHRGSNRLQARFHFRITNTDEGFADLLADEADMVMSLREIRPSEVALAQEAGLGDLQGANRSRVIALDALVPVVAASNPVNEITLGNLARVLSGQVANWAQLGGPDAPITVYMRDDASGLSQAIEDRVLRPVSASLVTEASRHETNAALARAISRDPFGLGIVSFSETGNAKPLALTGPCGFALRPTRRTIKTEDYPLTAPLFIYLPARRLPLVARDFLTFTRSAPAQIVIRRAGFVDQAPEELPINLQGDRFANAISVAESAGGLKELKRMVDVLGPMKRLTTSFRFEPGSVRLDAQSRSNVQQLARSLETGQYDARRMVFVGFSDGDGPAAANMGIAERRADAVRASVVEAAETANFNQMDIEVTAFGEAMPMACDNTGWGRQVNRRVEVWLE